ncbi:MAG: hypothetical protein KKD01_03865 [Proteobacteria bacterium]|nr:hypothetical protein [Pseudomonadota bacterium]
MGLLSSMWDGESACIGVVEDVSATGIKVSQIPSRFDKYCQECFSVVHGPLQDFKIILHPSWKLETRKEMYQLIGFEVVNPAANWKEFIAATFANSKQK